MEYYKKSRLHVLALFAGVESFAQETKKYVQKVRSLKEKGTYCTVLIHYT